MKKIFATIAAVGFGISAGAQAQSNSPTPGQTLFSCIQNGAPVRLSVGIPNTLHLEGLGSIFEYNPIVSARVQNQIHGAGSETIFSTAGGDDVTLREDTTDPSSPVYSIFNLAYGRECDAGSTVVNKEALSALVAQNSVKKDEFAYITCTRAGSPEERFELTIHEGVQPETLVLQSTAQPNSRNYGPMVLVVEQARTFSVAHEDVVLLEGKGSQSIFALGKHRAPWTSLRIGRDQTSGEISFQTNLPLSRQKDLDQKLTSCSVQNEEYLKKILGSQYSEQH